MCFLEVDVQYIEKLHELQNDLPFLPKIIKIENAEELVANLHAHKKFKTSIKSLISIKNTSQCN